MEELFFRFAHRFEWVEPRRRAWAYVWGLLAPLERRNGWTLAVQAGHVSPDGLQGIMLCSPAWDRDAVRDDVRDYVVEQIGDLVGVLVADETGFVRKGTVRRRGSNGSIRARWVKLRTARSARFCVTPRRGVGR